MFGFFDKKDETEKLLRGRDQQAENIPIHTMARDLESTDQPEIKPGDEPAADGLPSASRININSLTDQQKTSPFLNKKVLSEASIPTLSKPISELVARPEASPQPRPFVPPAPQPMPDPAPKSIPNNPLPKDLFISAKEEADLEKYTEPGSGGNNKKLILILIVVLIVTFVFAGGYYFWSTRKNIQAPEPIAQETPAEEQTGSAPEEKVTDTEESVVPKFSTGGPNYLEFDSSSALPDAMKETLKSYVQEVQASGISGAAEFKIVTLEKIPVSLPTFLEKMGIKFSPELASSLEDNFSLYIYNDLGGPGVGLSIAAKKETELEDILINEENNFPGELAPIFPVEQYTIEKNKKFNSSQYDTFGGVTIRYLNIISPENLSVDYAIYKQRLNIGTTRQTLRSIIDKLNGITAFVSTGNSQNNIDINGDNPPVIDYRDFLVKFKSCTSATTEYTLVDGLTYKYEIIGIKDGMCSVKSSFTKNPNPDWIGKEMTCSYDNSKDFQTAVTDMSKCTGQLYDLMGRPTSAIPL